MNNINEKQETIDSILEELDKLKQLLIKQHEVEMMGYHNLQWEAIEEDA